MSLKWAWDRCRALAPAGDLDHDFGRTAHCAPDLIQLGTTELQGRVTPPPPVAHEIQFAQPAACRQARQNGFQWV
jgi:hypothetical protein